MRSPLSILIASLLLLAPVLMGPACVPTQPIDPVVSEIVVGDYILRVWLEESVRVGRTQGEYRYAGEIVNGSGRDIDGLMILVSVPPNAFNTDVVDAVLDFGLVNDGVTAPSLDTYAIEQDRRAAFDPSVLVYQVIEGIPPAVPDVVGSVDESGGVLQSPAGDVVLDFAAGAVPAATPIRISKLENLGLPRLLPSGTRDFGPDGAVFDEPVTLTLTYDEAELPDGLPETDEAIFMVTIDHATGDLVPVPGSTLDPVANTLTAEISGFSAKGTAINCEIREPGSGRSIFCPEPVDPGFDDEGGDLDPSFGNGGMAVIDLGSRFAGVRDILIDDAGRLLLAGQNPHMSIAAVLPDGSGLDPAFGMNGIAEAHPGLDSEAYQIRMTSDGRLLVAGWSNSPNVSFHFFVGRFLSNGVADPTFGDGTVGVGLIKEFRQRDYPTGLIALPDGGVLVSSPEYLYQYLPNASPDPSFGVDGIASTGVVRPSDIARRANGQILVPRGAGMIRFDGQTGALLGASSDPKESFSSWDMTSLPGGVFATGGTIRLDGDDYDSAAVGRIIPALVPGAPGFLGDPNFGNGHGRAVADLGEDVFIEAVAVQEATAADPEDRIVAVGFTNTPGARDMIILRFRRDGVLDGGFGTDGVIRIDMGPADLARAVTIDDAGRIVVAGNSEIAGENRAVVMRLLP